MTTKRQREVVRALGKENQNKRVAHEGLGIKTSSVRSSVTRTYQSFIEDLKLVDEYFPVFERRLKKDTETYKLLRRVARKIRKE